MGEQVVVDTCHHLSASGLGVVGVWKCDACPVLWRYVRDEGDYFDRRVELTVDEAIAIAAHKCREAIDRCDETLRELGRVRDELAWLRDFITGAK